MEISPSRRPERRGSETTVEPDEVAAIMAALALFEARAMESTPQQTSVWSIAGRLEAQGLPVAPGLHTKWRR